MIPDYVQLNDCGFDDRSSFELIMELLSLIALAGCDGDINLDNFFFWNVVGREAYSRQAKLQKMIHGDHFLLKTNPPPTNLCPCPVPRWTALPLLQVTSSLVYLKYMNFNRFSMGDNASPKIANLTLSVNINGKCDLCVAFFFELTSQNLQ